MEISGNQWKTVDTHERLVPRCCRVALGTAPLELLPARRGEFRFSHAKLLVDRGLGTP